MILVLLGPPGSGKGTQAKRLSTEKSWPQLSTGDMLRAAIRIGSDLGKRAKSFMDKGSLVPDEVVIGLIAERTQSPDCSQGFILDGFPRTVPQAESLDRTLASRGLATNRAVLFEVDDSQLVRRLSGRRTCEKCSAMYHVETQQPKALGICDQCGGKLIQRSDDLETVIQNRLKVYHDQTAPLVGFYEHQKKLRRIDASLDIASVQKALAGSIQ